MVYLLIIDTSTERGVVALSHKNEVLAMECLPFGHQSSQYLMTALQKLISNCRVELKSLSAIGVGIGPGSFTGIRVGVAVAKGLGCALGCPLISFSSLQGFAPSKEGIFTSVIDARFFGAYTLIQEKKGNHVQQLSSVTLYSHEELRKQLRGNVVGPSFERLKMDNAEEEGPDTQVLANLIYESYQKQEIKQAHEVKVEYLSPLYAQNSR